MLYIADNPGLRGVLPAALWRLTRLEGLVLSNCGLGSVPAEIGGLAALRVLWVDNPDVAALPAAVGRLTRLTELYICGCTGLYPSAAGRVEAQRRIAGMLPAGRKISAEGRGRLRAQGCQRQDGVAVGRAQQARRGLRDAAGMHALRQLASRVDAKFISVVFERFRYQFRYRRTTCTVSCISSVTACVLHTR
eukprot:SAG22_NODE_3502_length_1678_cov_2.716276_2_plen_192_part_00